MHSKLSGLALVVCLGASAPALTLAPSTAWAQPKTKKAATEAGGDKSIEKQSAWEQKVMGEDSAKKNDMKKIAAAQKLAEEARKNPPPEPAKKVKDPNKEGARAKSEASIGLPIESEEAQKSQSKKPVVAKKVEPSNSANDELGALVAASLADERKGSGSSSVSAASDTSSSRGRKGNASRAKASAKPASPSSLDRVFSSSH